MTADEYKLSPLALFGRLDHKLADLLFYFLLTTFRTLYLALFVFAYGHYHFKGLLAVQTLVFISGHG